MAERKCGSGISHFWQLKQSVSGKPNFRSSTVKAEQKCRSGTSHLWKSRHRWNAEVNRPIFGSPGGTSAEMELEIFRSPGRTEVWKAEFHIFANQGRAEVLKRSFRPLEVLTEQKCWSWISYLWQARQDGSAEAELHIFGIIGRAEVQNGTRVTSWVAKAEWRCESGTSHHW